MCTHDINQTVCKQHWLKINNKVLENRLVFIKTTVSQFPYGLPPFKVVFYLFVLFYILCEHTLNSSCAV